MGGIDLGLRMVMKRTTDFVFYKCKRIKKNHDKLSHSHHLGTCLSSFNKMKNSSRKMEQRLLHRIEINFNTFYNCTIIIYYQIKLQ